MWDSPLTGSAQSTEVIPLSDHSTPTMEHGYHYQPLTKRISDCEQEENSLKRQNVYQSISPGNYILQRYF